MADRSYENDVLIVAGIRNNDLAAFKILYNRYSRKLYCFSQKYLHNPIESEELVQIVFISIWEHRKSLDITLPVKNYLYRSAVNYIYNFLKKKAVRLKYISSELKRSPDEYNDVYDQVYYHDLEKSINDIIKTLPEQQQRIFYYSRIINYSHEQIAAKLNISVRTVENQIYRAIKVLKKQLQIHI